MRVCYWTFCKRRCFFSFKLSRSFFRRDLYYTIFFAFSRSFLSRNSRDEGEIALAFIATRHVAGEEDARTSPQRYLRRRTVLPLILECAFASSFLFLTHDDRDGSSGCLSAIKRAQRGTNMNHYVFCMHNIRRSRSTRITFIITKPTPRIVLHFSLIN